MIEKIIVILASFITFIWTNIQTGKISVSIPVAINTSVSSLVLLNQSKKMSLDIGFLNKHTIKWLAYLSSIEKPAGIIHNSTDRVVWVNKYSVLKIGEQTTKTHINPENLIKIRDAVIKLDEIDPEEIQIDNTSYVYKSNYLLSMRNQTLEIIDSFYKLTINKDTFRIFVCDLKRHIE